MASGSNGIFMEIHPDPSKALSDKDTQIPLIEVGSLIKELTALSNYVRMLN